jgi:integrase
LSSTALRDDLHAVGVARAILFEDDEANVEQLRFHDLRSTFCTWARRAGKSDAWISKRTGHTLVPYPARAQPAGSYAQTRHAAPTAVGRVRLRRGDRRGA